MITHILPYLKQKGYLVATIKHDGHDFEADVPGTDSYRHAQAGAYGTAVFSGTKYMIVKQQTMISEQDLIRYFPEADIILLEGFKFSSYPKIEIIRKGIKEQSACMKFGLEAIATDLPSIHVDSAIPIFGLEDYQEIADFIEGRYKEVIQWGK